MRASDFDYDLPQDLVAQTPADRREDARLLVLDRASDTLEHRGIPALTELLRPGDLLVVNDTRVVPARVFGHRESGGRVEFLLMPASGGTAETACEALAKAGGTLREAEEVALDAGGTLRIDRRLGRGRFVVSTVGEDLAALMDRAGKMPLPPYIRREQEDARDALDRRRYQTVFAREPGAVAAPTAGLHLTDALLDRLRERGVEQARVTLHVGLGTFRPIQTEDIAAHEMHEEAFVVPAAVCDAVAAARSRGGRVIAVGTTSVRALESAAASGELQPGRGASRLFILPGYRFRVVDGLLTNFHLPRSTLLCLVAALAGRDRILDAYRTAVAERYRFYSYGDAMLIV